MSNRNVIYGIIFFSLIGFYEQSYCQTSIEGKYCLMPITEEDSSCIIFNTNGRFNKIFGVHVGRNSELSGNWTLKNGFVELEYDSPVIDKAYYLNTYLMESAKDSVNIFFKVKDFNKGPTAGLIIKINSREETLMVDENGEASLKLKRMNEMVLGQTSYLGYEYAYFSAPQNKNVLLEIFVNESIKEYPPRSNDTLEVSKDFLILKNVKSTPNIIWIKR